MSHRNEIKFSQTELRSMFDYSPYTGILIRKSGAFKGMPAGWTAPKRYMRVYIKGKIYSVHRIIWVWMYGENPEVIDHINGNRSDNRISNLRSCTERENAQNLLKHRLGGTCGAYITESGNKWKARISIGDHNVYLGSFVSEELALAAYSGEAAVMKRLESHKETINE